MTRGAGLSFNTLYFFPLHPEGRPWDSSRGNHSKRRRCGLTLRYCTPDVRALPGYGWEREGVLISGRAPEGHWANPPRPERDVEITPASLTQMPGFGKKD